jgi:hypothetical protein
MPGLSDITSRLQFRSRIDSVTKTAVDDFRNQGAWTMLTGLFTRFGQNNRRVLGR